MSFSLQFILDTLVSSITNRTVSRPPCQHIVGLFFKLPDIVAYRVKQCVSKSLHVPFLLLILLSSITSGTSSMSQLITMPYRQSISFAQGIKISRRLIANHSGNGVLLDFTWLLRSIALGINPPATIR